MHACRDLVTVTVRHFLVAATGKGGVETLEWRYTQLPSGIKFILLMCGVSGALAAGARHVELGAWCLGMLTRLQYGVVW
jgi:hypothetical protein